MYADFFGFRELPFNNTPDPRFFFATPDHEEGLASLIYAVQERKGFVLLTGEVGTGKTLVTRMMLRHFGTQLSFANISHGIQNPVELMESICTEFEIECEPGASTTQLTRMLHDFLLGQFAQDIPVVLVLDEAQNLPVQAFEQLRMIGNLEADDAKLLQIAIVGQPELQRRFLSPKLRQLRQRIFRSYHLPALSRDVAEQYIRHRLAVVTDANEEVFDTEAVTEIFRISEGLPRIINTVCDNALLSAYSVGQRQIDGPFLRSVVSQMMILGDPPQEHRHTPPPSSSSRALIDDERTKNAPVVSAPAPTGRQASSLITAKVGQRGPLPSSAADALRIEPSGGRGAPRMPEKRASEQMARTEELVRAVAKECREAQTLHDSLTGLVQNVTDATARAEAASRTIEHRDAQLRKVSTTVSDLMRNLRALLDRARETTADIVSVERGARKTHGRLSEQISGASRLAEKLAGFSDRGIPRPRQNPPGGVQSNAAPLDVSAGPIPANDGEIVRHATHTPAPSPSQDRARPVEELLRNARASLSDLRTLAGTGRSTCYVPSPDIDQKAESATRLANQVENILEMIEPTQAVMPV